MKQIFVSAILFCFLILDLSASQYYWKNGSRQGSEYYWVNSSGESFPNTNTIGICMSLMDNMNNVPELCKGYR